MLDLMKKAVLTGIGVASLTKEKVEEIAKDFAEKGKMSEQEGEKFVSDLLKKSEESRQALMAQVEKMVGTAVGSMNLAKVSDIDAVKQELAELRLELEALKKENMETGTPKG